MKSLETFSSPKDYLEQYQTPPSVTGEMIHYITNNYDLNNYSIADLGCGTGILGISAALCVYLFLIVVLGVVRKRDAAYIPFISKFDRFLWS